MHQILIIAVGLSFGGLIEAIQPYVDIFNDFYDFTADAFGVLIGFLLGVVVHNLKLKTVVWDGSQPTYDATKWHESRFSVCEGSF